MLPGRSLEKRKGISRCIYAICNHLSISISVALEEERAQKSREEERKERTDISLFSYIAPPIITSLFTSFGRFGSSASARQMLVRGPTATRVIRPEKR
jgi:hypothetical protein